MKRITMLVCFSFLLIGCGSKKGLNSTAESFTKAHVKNYDKVITEDALTKEGLFDVHEVQNRYFFEIPDSLLSRDILVVTRFIKTPGGAGNYGGEEIGEIENIIGVERPLLN